MRGSRAATLKRCFIDRPLARGPSLLWLGINGALIAVCKSGGFLQAFGLANGARFQEMEASCQDASAVMESHYDQQTVEFSVIIGGSGGCHRAGASQGVNLSIGAAGPFSGQRGMVEKLWQDFFSDPLQWWDHRSEKVNARYPDFKHKETNDALWLNDRLKPPWVEAELAAMAPGTVQLSIFHWNARLARYAKAGQYEKIMQLFQQMQQEGIPPDSLTFVRVINACANLQAHEEGRCIHTQVTQSGWESNVYVGSSLVDMYAKCGSMEEAWRVFHRMPTRNVVSWNAMILGYVKCGQGHKALDLFRQMQHEDMQPVPATFLAVLSACVSVGAIEECRHAHEQIIQSGYESDVLVSSSLVDMYVKCGSIGDAWKVFNKMPTHNIICWNAMILGHVKCGQGHKALELFQYMQDEGVEPVPATFVGLLNACASLLALEQGRHFHEQIIHSEFESDVFVGSSLIDMYAKCGSIEDARTVFDRAPTRDVVYWNAMMLGYVKCGQGQKALELFCQMKQDGMHPVPATFIVVINACASISALQEGRHIHEQITQSGCESDVFVSSGLIDMYTKCGSIEDAKSVFNRMPIRNVISWNAMILGYVKSGQAHKALDLSRNMQLEGQQPDAVSFVGVLNACASVAALEQGRRFHGEIIQSGFESDVFVGTSLIDMYAKCGSIEDAWQVFNKMPTRNVVSWNAMLGGYAMHGLAEEAVEFFKWMCEEGVKLDRVTFVSLLSACSHAGLVDEGLHYFESMSSVHQVSATAEHYACLIDLFGRAGRLDEAEDLVKRMPRNPDTSVWRALLAACRVHCNAEMGECIVT